LIRHYWLLLAMTLAIIDATLILITPCHWCWLLSLMIIDAIITPLRHYIDIDYYWYY
jgi:hypothetical protein